MKIIKDAARYAAKLLNEAAGKFDTDENEAVCADVAATDEREDAATQIRAAVEARAKKLTEGRVDLGSIRNTLTEEQARDVSRQIADQVAAKIARGEATDNAFITVEVNGEKIEGIVKQVRVDKHGNKINNKLDGECCDDPKCPVRKLYRALQTPGRPEDRPKVRTMLARAAEADWDEMPPETREGFLRLSGKTPSVMFIEYADKMILAVDALRTREPSKARPIIEAAVSDDLPAFRRELKKVSMEALEKMVAAQQASSPDRVVN